MPAGQVELKVVERLSNYKRFCNKSAPCISSVHLHCSRKLCQRTLPRCILRVL